MKTSMYLGLPLPITSGFKGTTMLFTTEEDVRFRAVELAIDTVGHEDGEWVELADLIVAFVNDDIEWIDIEEDKEEVFEDEEEGEEENV